MLPYITSLHLLAHIAGKVVSVVRRLLLDWSSGILLCSKTRSPSVMFVTSSFGCSISGEVDDNDTDTARVEIPSSG